MLIISHLQSAKVHILIDAVGLLVGFTAIIPAMFTPVF
jgi:hypothetical protein